MRTNPTHACVSCSTVIQLVRSIIPHFTLLLRSQRPFPILRTSLPHGLSRVEEVVRPEIHRQTCLSDCQNRRGVPFSSNAVVVERREKLPRDGWINLRSDARRVHHLLRGVGLIMVRVVVRVKDMQGTGEMIRESGQRRFSFACDSSKIPQPQQVKMETVSSKVQAKPPPNTPSPTLSQGDLATLKNVFSPHTRKRHWGRASIANTSVQEGTSKHQNNENAPDRPTSRTVSGRP